MGQPAGRQPEREGGSVNDDERICKRNTYLIESKDLLNLEKVRQPRKAQIKKSP